MGNRVKNTVITKKRLRIGPVLAKKKEENGRVANRFVIGIGSKHGSQIR